MSKDKITYKEIESEIDFKTMEIAAENMPTLFEEKEDIRQESVFLQNAQEQQDYRNAFLLCSPFEQRFIEAYIKTNNATEAARIAGSTAKNPNVVGHQTLHREHVRKLIALGKKIRLNAVAMDRTEVISYFRQIWYAAMKDGKYTDANKAAEMLGQALGMFKPATPAGNKLQVMAKAGQEIEGVTVGINMDTNTDYEVVKQENKELGEEILRMTSILDQVKLRDKNRGDN